MNTRISAEELQKRLTRLVNLESMYVRQVATNKKLKDENKRLKAKVIELEKENKELHERVQSLELIVEELQRMIFKKKKKKEPEKVIPEKEKQKIGSRTTDSYRRKLPNEKNITDIKTYQLGCCPDCESDLERRKVVIRYVEDMHLPTAEYTVLNKTTKECI